MFDQHAPHARAILPVNFAGRNCWLMTVWEALRASAVQFGGTVKWGERAQWIEKHHCQPDSYENRQFYFYVPSDLELGDNWLMIAEVHLSWNMLFGLYLTKDALKLYINDINPDGSLLRQSYNHDLPYTRDAWNEAKVNVHFNGHDKPTGEIYAWLNDVVFPQYRGHVLMPAAEGVMTDGRKPGPCWCYGPYNAFPMPAGTKKQEIYMQLGFNAWEPTK